MSMTLATHFRDSKYSHFTYKCTCVWLSHQSLRIFHNLTVTQTFCQNVSGNEWHCKNSKMIHHFEIFCHCLNLTLLFLRGDTTELKFSEWAGICSPQPTSVVHHVWLLANSGKMCEAKKHDSCHMTGLLRDRQRVLYQMELAVSPSLRNVCPLLFYYETSLNN